MLDLFGSFTADHVSTSVMSWRVCFAAFYLPISFGIGVYRNINRLFENEEK